MTEVLEVEHWIRCPQGRLYSKQWTPTNLASEQTILLFHDSLGCVALWRDFPKQLAIATGRRVLAYDRLGFGRSAARTDILEKGFVREEAVSFIPILLKELSIGDFIACGHSVGGGMAVETGCAFPETCKAVVTIAAQAFVEDRTIEGIKKAQAEFFSTESLGRLAKYHGEKTGWVLQAWIDTWLAPDFAGWSLDAALDALKCPVLAIHGELDQYGSAAHPERIAGRRGMSKILQGVGHNPHRESAELLISIIREWIAPGLSER